MKYRAYTPGRNIFGNKAKTYLVKPTKENMNTMIFEIATTLSAGSEIEYTVDTSALSPAECEVFEKKLKALMRLLMK